MPFFCMPFMACNRQVDSLDRRQCNLQAVPAEVERYARSLEELLLDMNHIKELSKSLFRLHKLRRLNLSDNDIYRLPADIGNLHSLVELNLSRNDISDLPDDLKVCRQLMMLDLSSNPITRLPATISQLSSLTCLGLNDVSLTQLPQDIGQLVNLRSLEVRENLIRSLPASISDLKNLQRLDLGQNELDELPSELGRLSSLQELYVDSNDLEMLPEAVTRCRVLQQLDASDNKLMVLPDDLGELDQLSDLVLSQNCLQILPHSIGRLKALTILKVDKNQLTSLTPAIGSCHLLQELLLTENLLSELPSAIGNLKALKNLNADKNQLTEIPTTIGGCVSLAMLSLRDNHLDHLPLEIGKLEKLRVLDVCNNRLVYLPFTINVLFNLQALWLSENQSQAMLKLTTDQDPRTGIKVLTCYLLPQHSAAGAQDPEKQPNRSFVGGPKVHFTDQEASQDEEQLGPIGQFERHDTPHPKPHTHAPKLKKQTIDGHIIHHDDEHSHPQQLALASSATRKRSGDEGSPNSPPPSSGADGRPTPPPRSALKHPPILPQQPQQGQGRATPEPLQQDRSVVFSADVVDKESSRLKRVNTPHYTKASRIVHDADAEKKVERVIVSSSSIAEPQQTSTSLPVTSLETHRIIVRRDATGLGLSIAGGLGSTPFKGDDFGLFVSRLVENGPAERAGLRIGDKLVRVNATDVLRVHHDAAVQAMQESMDVVELLVLRERLPSRTNLPLNTPSPTPLGGQQQERSKTPTSLDTSFLSDSGEGSSTTRETITTVIRRDGNGSPGFAVVGGRGVVQPGRQGDEGIYISALTPGGPADRDGRVRIGDRVVSINGTNMKGARHDQAVALLTGHGNEVYLVVQRDRLTVTSPLTTSPSNLNKSPTISSPKSHSREPPQRTHGYGDISWDGTTEEVTLARDGHSLGLSIVGGSDHSSQPFGIGNPGVFISKITAGSPAARSQRLRIGDRILVVNGKEIRHSKHIEAVEILKASGQTVRLSVLHEAQPRGLHEVVMHKKAKEALGLNICGGAQGTPANPLDRTDEGIFIERISPEGAAASSNALRVGMRLLEVNEESLIGCTQAEAAQALRNAGARVRLLVCDGFEQANNSTALNGHSSSSTQSQHLLHIDTSYEQSASPSPLSPGQPVIDRPPLATSSPLPPPTETSNQVDQVDHETPLGNNYPSAAAVGHLLLLTPTQLKVVLPEEEEEEEYGKQNGNSPRSPLVSIAGGVTMEQLEQSNKTRTVNGYNSMIPVPASRAVASTSRLPSTTAPLSTSSTTITTASTSRIPTTTTSSSQSRIPPPVMPKPASIYTKPQPPKVPEPPKQAISSSSPLTPPEKQSFNARLKNFEHEIEINKPNNNSTTNLANAPPPPAKISLLSAEDMRKMKEEERIKLQSSTNVVNHHHYHHNTSFSPSEEQQDQRMFEHLLDNRPVPSPTLPAVVRTKKAENRFAAASPPPIVSSPSGGEPLNEVEQRAIDAMDARKRQEWRQARLASLDEHGRQAELLVNQMNQIWALNNSRLTNISEEPGAHSIPPSPVPAMNERILHNETSTERVQSIDPITGASSVSVIETSITQRQYERPLMTTGMSEIGFADDDLDKER